MSAPVPCPPDVSVVIPVHNRTPFLVRAVRSCLADQGSVSVEVVVVDDGSDEPIRPALQEHFPGRVFDQSQADSRSAAGDRVVYSRQAQAGAAQARNRGLKLATGRYVKFLDSDDELIPGNLALEVALAETTGADCVVSGWGERDFASCEAAVPTRVRHVRCPQVQDGIDDLLLGRGVWTAAALYRRDFIGELRWDPMHGKADDWGWFSTVCLAGARFACLEQATAYYNQWPLPRITNRGDTFAESTEVRQRILEQIERELDRQGILTRNRREHLVQYYYKDAKVLCASSWRQWRAVWRHCRELAPGFLPAEYDGVARPLVRSLGPFWGVLAFVQARRFARFLGLRRSV